MTATGDARQAGDGATAQLKAPVRYALAVGLLVVGVGDLLAIDGFLLPRYLAAATSVGALPLGLPVPAVLPPVGQPVVEAAVAEVAVAQAAVAVQPAELAPMPEPPADAAPASGSQDELEFPHLRFASNTTWLSPAAKETLGRLVAVLGEHPSRRVVLSGHTDRIGPEELNRALSLERARRSLRWLSARGIDPARIEIHGFGSTRPLEVDVSPESQARNRRVEIDLR